MAVKPPSSRARLTPERPADATRTRAVGEALEARLDFVEDLLTRACTFREIRRFCRDKFNVQQRQADEYVAKVHERWKEERHKDREAARERQRRRLMRMIRRADEDRDLRAARGFEELLMRIDGTEYAPGDDAKTDNTKRVIWRGGAAVAPEPAK